MRSRADAIRVGVERALRVLTLLVLAFAAWKATQTAPRDGPEIAGDARLGELLDRWTAVSPPLVHISLDRAATGVHRAWLRALRSAGTTVSWRSNGIPALALEVAPSADPQGGMMMWIAAPTASPIAVADAVAPIDTVEARSGGAIVLAPATIGRLTSAVGGHRASATPRDSIRPRRVLVLGRATWEAKFVIMALEEAGWGVEARLGVAPGVEVVQGAPGAPDTSRHAAVVILDTPSSAIASAVTRYVRVGGGAILAGASATAPVLAALAAGRTGSRIRPSSVAFADDAPGGALTFVPIIPRADAIVLEEQDGRVAIAARRVDAGRVVQIGYDETWRWRLGGGGQAPNAHRAWWSAFVSSVAYRAADMLPRDPGDDDAPLAHLVDELGAPGRNVPLVTNGGRWAPSRALLFTIVSLLLLTELASRRLRGAP